MTFTRRSAVVLFCMLLAGCTVWQNARRTMIQEPREYCWKQDKELSQAVYRYWADQAWQAQCGPELADWEAGDYGIGFCDGFVDFCYLGGTGNPPPVPPRQYWEACVRTAEGRQHANQWAAGYRHGAETARNGGYRGRAVLPSSLGLAPCETGIPLFTEPSPEAIQAPDASYEAIPPPIEPDDVALPPNPFPDELSSPANATDHTDGPPHGLAPPPEPPQ